MKLLAVLFLIVASFTANAENAQSPLVCMNRAAFVGQVIASRDAKWPEETVKDRVGATLQKLHEQMGVPVSEVPAMLQEIHNVYSHPDDDYNELMRSFLRRCSGAVAT